MTPEELKAMLKATKKAKRIASEKAGELHDLVEDRLPAAYEDIPAVAQATYDACQAWAEAEAAYKAAEAKLA
ncbi:MAG: CCE_0567 family metalloprotein [Candidatus Thiodiazotropha sp.]